MAQRKEIFVIQKEGEKSYWHRCGVGFVNQDDSITLNGEANCGKCDTYHGGSQKQKNAQLNHR